MRGAEGFSLGEGQRRIELTIKYINEDDVVLAFFTAAIGIGSNKYKEESLHCCTTRECS